MNIEACDSFVQQFWNIESSLASDLVNMKRESDSKVKFVLNPLDYALDPHMKFLTKYLDGPRRVLFVGLNPGPWGMCQTGIPFGDVGQCKDFLNITGHVLKPENVPQKIKMLGFDSPRREVSGDRFWSFIATKWNSSESFFKDCFVLNYCPLAFLSETGKNITPAEFRPGDKKKVYELCDKALFRILSLLQATEIIAVGRVVNERLIKVRQKFSLDINIHFLMHPSPANPAANKGWSEIAEKSLSELNIFH